MVSSSDWIRAATEALATNGIDAVRIDRLAASLGVTKGSFFHHFRSARALRQAVLDQHEATQRDLVRAIDDATRGLNVDDALDAATERALVAIDVDLERSVRAWAATDDAAATTVAVIDAARLDLLERIWPRATEPAPARTAALVPHLVVIGALSTPAVTRTDLQDVLAMLRVVATAVPRRAAD